MGKENEGSKKKVMVAIDESEHSYHALMWALDNLKELLANSPLVIFAAQPNPDCFQRYGSTMGNGCMACPVPATPSLISPVLLKNEEMADRLLDKAESICADRGVKTEATTEAGEPKELICKAVQDYNINLLVIGSHPVGFLQRIFGGSLSDYCVNNAKCTVVVVKNPE